MHVREKPSLKKKAERPRLRAHVEDMPARPTLKQPPPKKMNDEERVEAAQRNHDAIQSTELVQQPARIHRPGQPQTVVEVVYAIARVVGQPERPKLRKANNPLDNVAPAELAAARPHIKKGKR